MAMTLRLTEEETELLRQVAQLEGRSMQEIAREAVNSAVEQKLRMKLIEHISDTEVSRFADAIRRLGE